jgi:hypothetical protein
MGVFSQPSEEKRVRSYRMSWGFDSLWWCGWCDQPSEEKREGAGPKVELKRAADKEYFQAQMAAIDEWIAVRSPAGGGLGKRGMMLFRNRRTTVMVRIWIIIIIIIIIIVIIITLSSSSSS